MFRFPRQELDLEGFDKCLVAVIAFLVLESINDQFALNNDPVAFFKVLSAGLCGFAPAFDINKTYFVFAVVVGNAEGDKQVAVSDLLGLGICAQVPANNDVIQPHD